MPTLKVSLENCYGIRKFNEEFNFDSGHNTLRKTKCYAIYASNGSMKSSLADTFYARQNSVQGEPRDRMYPERETLCDILWDGSSIDPKTIYVVKTLNDSAFNEPPAGVARLLINEGLKKEYERIYTKLQSEKDTYITKLKKISGSSDCEDELLGTFAGGNPANSIYEILSNAASKISGKQYSVYNFKYNDVFDKSNKVRDFVEKNKELLQEYANTYNRLLDESTFFSRESSFGTYQAKEINKDVKDDGFFGAGHRFRLKGKDNEIESSKQFSEVIKDEIKRIITDDDARGAFDRIDAALQANINLRTFQAALNKDNSIAAKIVDYDDFKAEVWYGFLSKSESDLAILVETYKRVKPNLDKISKQAEVEQDYWKNAVGEFNSRFKNLPFRLNVVNRRDVVLNSVAPTIDFTFDDKQGDGPKPTKAKDLKETLSHGEKRALHLLSVIFDIKARKVDKKETLFIFDDAVDSFDYKNKFAIIQYIKDVTSVENFYALILTHNFDFLRAIERRGIVDYSGCKHAYRLGPETKLEAMVDIRNPFIEAWKKDLNNNRSMLIASIPFTRNIVEYTQGKDNKDYKTLSAMLHAKKASRGLIVKELNDILSRTFPGIVLAANEKDKLYDLIIDTARSYPTSGELKLQEKIVLSIASRLMAETYARSHIKGSVLDDLEEAENPTSKIFEAFEVNNPNTQGEVVSTLGEVLLMTPDNIHLNAFMYEPIIDLGSDELHSLFNDVEKVLT